MGGRVILHHSGSDLAQCSDRGTGPKEQKERPKSRLLLDPLVAHQRDQVAPCNRKGGNGQGTQSAQTLSLMDKKRRGLAMSASTQLASSRNPLHRESWFGRHIAELYWRNGPTSIDRSAYMWSMAPPGLLAPALSFILHRLTVSRSGWSTPTSFALVFEPRLKDRNTKYFVTMSSSPLMAVRGKRFLSSSKSLHDCRCRMSSSIRGAMGTPFRSIINGPVVCPMSRDKAIALFSHWRTLIPLPVTLQQGRRLLGFSPLTR